MRRRTILPRNRTPEERRKWMREYMRRYRRTPTGHATTYAAKKKWRAANKEHLKRYVKAWRAKRKAEMNALKKRIDEIDGQKK